MKKIKKILFSIIVGLTVTLILEFVGFIQRPDTACADNLCEGIASKILRFHVIANSDADNDQELKLHVKDAVITYMSDYLNEDMNLSEAVDTVTQMQDDILNIAREILWQYGYDYEVTCGIEQTYFPIKSYGDITIPEGEYTAFCIKIGNAEGKNWWCILYPPLCFVDISYGIVPDDSKILLEKILTPDEYNAVVNAIQEGEADFQFRYLTFLNRFL